MGQVISAFHYRTLAPPWITSDSISCLINTAHPVKIGLACTPDHNVTRLCHEAIV